MVKSIGAKIPITTNFKAQNTAPANVGVVNPAPVSNNPYEERHGYIKNDVYKLKSDNSDMKPLLARPTMDLFPEVTDMHDGKKSKTTSSILKPLLTVGAIGGGIYLAAKKRKNIAGIFRESLSEIDSFSKFDKYYTDIQNKIRTDKIKNIRLPNKIKIVLDGKTPDEKKEALKKAYEIAVTYTKQDTQPKVTVLFPEEIEAKASDIINKIGKGKLDDIDIADIAKIESFEITKTGKSHPEIAVKEKIRRSVHVYSWRDQFNSTLQRTKEFFGNP